QAIGHLGEPAPIAQHQPAGPDSLLHLEPAQAARRGPLPGGDPVSPCPGRPRPAGAGRPAMADQGADQSLLLAALMQTAELSLLLVLLAPSFHPSASPVEPRQDRGLESGLIMQF